MEIINTETGEITPAPVQLRNANPLTRVRVAKRFPSPSLAKQSFLDECNINNIMRKYNKTGLIEHVAKQQGQYGNFIGFQDYHTSLNLILEAQESFAEIPSDIRKNFDNDPEKFLEFCQNPENIDSMIEMGLAHRKPPEPGTGETPPKGGATPKKQETDAAAAALAAEAALPEKKNL